MLEAKQIEKCYKLLSNYDWIEAKIHHHLFGMQSLIEDYKLIENTQLSDYPEDNRETLKDLKLIKEALQLSAHILNQDKKQLAGQLIGRLLPFKKRITIQNLLEQIDQTPIKYLRPLTASLTPPGNGLIRTLRGHLASVSALAVTGDGQYLVSGSRDRTIKV
ncbi:MAG: hypothetical protein QNJ72_35135 [Pleurocapsa sp. MO_226.B13]|nr:hypothetical protein [Pleurocapsa sp. MO_226.B13]